jgi:hypothetical protein
LSAVLLVISFQRLRPAQSQVDIVVTGADATKKVDVASSSTLNSLLAVFAARVGFDYSDSATEKVLVVMPEDARTLLGQVAKRVALDYADANLATNLAFPKPLINDTTPPTIPNDPQTSGAVISWTSTEFTKATVQYGSSSGSYTGSVSETEFTKNHQITIPGVQVGAQVFYKITQVDLSDNTSISPERDFLVRTRKYVYLPFVRKP